VATPAVPLPAQQVKGGTVIQPTIVVESAKPLDQELALAKDKRLGAVQAGNAVLLFDVDSDAKAKQDQSLKYASRDNKKLGDEAANTAAGYRLMEERSGRAITDLSAVQQEREGIEVKKERALKEPSLTPAEPLPEILTRDNAFSTFSLNVSDVSFKLAAASLEKGAMPEPGTIRSEEFVNAFDYHDPIPTAAARIGFVWDRAQYPFAHNRDILRFSLKTAAQGREAGKALNLVILLDNSGSMERADRVRLLQEALKVLAWQLQPQDRVSVVAFARTAHLWVDGLSGAQPEELLKRVMNLNPEGGTNLEDALNLAYATALRHFLSQGNNRVIMLTDGAANLGNIDPEALRNTIETHRRKGVALDCFGIGWEGYNDYMLATLSKYGDGRYGFLNRPETVNSEFAAQLAGALHVAAADVKAQVEFNPLRVVLYRQIGYAQHQLTQEQFRDNTVDAAEIGAAESGNALYVIQTDPKGSGPIATVRVRFKIPTTGEYTEKEWIIPWQPSVRALDQSAPAMRLAVVSAAFAEWLANSPYAGEVALSALDRFLNGVSIVYQPDPRPAQLEGMIRQARSLTGK
jgi:Mg-chelatase subunit ChlD